MKGINMILGALATASLLFSMTAYAQDENQVVRGAYETNKAFDNTWIGIGAGVNANIVHVTKPKKWGNMGLALDINYGKWWTPFVGARVGLHGMWNNTAEAFDLQGIKKDASYGFHYLHADVLWNLSNTIWGYKEDRFWEVSPYISMGMLDVCNKRNVFSKGNKHNLEYAAGIGFLNVLKVTERVNVTLDLQALVAKSHAYTTANGRFIIFPSATVGLAFNLNKIGFDRHEAIAPVPVPVPFTTEQYNGLADKVAALEKENAALRDKAASLENQLAPYRKLVNGQTYLYENGTFTAVEVKAGTPVTLYFDCGSAKLSEREKAHLEYFTANAVNADTKLSVNGYADKQTGSARRNQQLSEQRVKAVVDLLKKAGASEANIETAAHGASVQLFDGAAKNRVVTIEVK